MNVSLNYPDDWHLHLRDGPMLASILSHTVRRFARAIIMPNLKPPIVNTFQALAYHERIVTALPIEANFLPLMTLYLTPSLTTEEIRRAINSGVVHAVKLYPAGVTTNSEAGISKLTDIYPILEILEKFAMPLLIHAETSDTKIDIFDREQVFIEQHLIPIVSNFPQLRIVMEHITTQEAVQFIESTNANVAATITAHHLLYNRNALLAGCLRPHFYCLPVLKREQARLALLAAATSGNPKFFLGTDSAPHAMLDKESACGCAGSFTAHAAIELYAEAFEQVGKLSKLEAFASWHGADFYRLPRNQTRLTLTNTPWQVPQYYACGDHQVVPLRAGETISWQIASNYPTPQSLPMTGEGINWLLTPSLVKGRGQGVR